MKKWLTVLCLAVLASCQKSNDNDEPVIPPTDHTTLTLSVADATPGDPVEIRVNKKVPSAQTVVTFNGTAINGYAMGDSAYVIIVPVVAPGKATIVVPALAGANSPELTIKTYTPIADPQAVISEFTDKRQRSIDSLTRGTQGTPFQPSAATLTLLSQLQEEWDVQMAQLAAGDKPLLAYILQKNMPNPAAYSFSPLEASYYARMSGQQGDVGDKLVAIAKEYVTAQTVCVASIPFMLGTGYFFVKAPNPWTGLAFLASFTTFVISREVAIKRAQEVGRLKGVADAILEAFVLKTTGEVEFTNNVERELSLSVGFRNLGSADAGLHSDIGTAFSRESELAAKDGEVESLYAKVSAVFSKLKGAYPTYVTVIGKVAKSTMALPVAGSQVTVKSVSDSRLAFTTTLSGSTRKVKITSTATTEFPFTLTVAYHRSLDNKEITRDIACTFNPNQYNYQLQVGDYNPDYTKISPVLTLKKGDAFSTPNYVNQMLRLTLDGVPVKVGPYGLDWTPVLFGSRPTSAADIVNNEYPVTVYDYTNRRSVTIPLKAVLLNTAYAAIVGRTVTVDYYQNNTKVGTTTFTYHADGKLERGGTFPSTSTWNWTITGAQAYDQCTNYIAKDQFAGAVSMAGGDIFTPGYLMIRTDGSFRANSFYGCTDRWDRYDIH
ncbi:MAG TPA: hypothetical protein VGE66_01320 [Chitinophagaceae bacterium]